MGLNENSNVYIAPPDVFYPVSWYQTEWTQHVDPDDGRVYWLSSITGKKKFEDPKKGDGNGPCPRDLYGYDLMDEAVMEKLTVCEVSSFSALVRAALPAREPRVL